MKNTTFKLAAITLAAASAFASQANAAGFQLSEQSTVQVGRAMAGAGVVGDDLSAVHYNPAGMTLLDGTRVQATNTWVAINLDYEGDSGATENGRKKGQAIPAGYITHQINDNLWAGLGLTVPFGMGTNYDQNWEVADRGTKSMILTFDINPNIAWKMNDYVSFGAGISLQYAKANLAMVQHGLSSEVDGDSWAWGWNVGMMVQPTEKVRVGLAYRSHIAHNAEGTTDFSLPNGVAFSSDMKVRIKTPDTVTLSATWEATDRLRLSGTARWSKWSNFQSLGFRHSNYNTAAGNAVAAQAGLNNVNIENNWDDTWFFSVGADLAINNQWTIRGGVAYDQGPVENTKRMAVIPDTDRVWFAGGATYKYSDNLTIDFGAGWITGVGDTDLYDTTGKHKGKFKSLDSYLASVQMQYRF